VGLLTRAGELQHRLRVEHLLAIEGEARPVAGAGQLARQVAARFGRVDHLGGVQRGLFCADDVEKGPPCLEGDPDR
jgi:hypothetical protein